MISFRARLGILISGTVFATVTALIQLLLGSDPLVVVGVVVSLAAVTLVIAWQPFSFGTWYAAYFFLQLYGIAWVVKTMLLLKFESGLVAPVAAIYWSTLFVLAACGLAGLWHFLTPPVSRLEGLYNDPDLWTRAGVVLLIVGEIAHLLAYVTNADEAGTFGGFDPLRRFSFAATCLFSSAAVARGKLFSIPLVIALILGVVDSLLFSEKTELFLRALAVGLIVLTSGLPFRKKLAFGSLLPVAFIFMNSLLFPAVHATREIRNKNLPMSERITLVKSMLGHSADDPSYLKSSTGNIWNENVNFLPTDNWFLLRFGSVAYFDVTLRFSRPASQPKSVFAFAGQAINQAFPLGLLGPKSEFSLADRLWAGMDSRIEPGGFLTMGSYASARVIFGNLKGFIINSFLLFLIGILVVRCYGNDVRFPLVMFVFVGIAYNLIDGDIENVVAYIVRFFWQDLFILLLVWYGFRFWHRVQPQE